MRALIFQDTASINTRNPAYKTSRYAINTVTSMGITPCLYTVDNGTPPDSAGYNAIITQFNADLVIIPSITSSNRNAFSPMFVAGAENGGSPVPVIAQMLNSVFTVRTPGLAQLYAGDLVTTAAKAEIVGIDETFYTYNKRFLLETDATLVAPEAVYPLVRGFGSESDAVAVAEYTPDGTHWVYYGNNHLNSTWLHLMMQAAINRGILAKPPHPSPCILNIDHINGSGSGSGGGTAIDGQPTSTVNGTIGDPDRIKVFGDILRSANGICYASLEQNYYPGASGSPDMVPNQIATLVEYADVFKYIACHDHGTLNLSTGNYLVNDGPDNAAIDDQETKADISASYEATKDGIEAMGLMVNTDFAHFAANAVGTHFWELAQDKVDITCDPAGLEAIQGYGFKMARVGVTVANESSYPSLSVGVHWLYSQTSFRGITLVTSRDGNTTNGAVVDLEDDAKTFSYNLAAVQDAQITYYHDTDMEDVNNNLSGTISDGTDATRMELMYRTGAAYQLACPDVYDWGADVTKYAPQITGTNL